MSRRASDKARDRIMIGLVVLTALSSILAAVIGYKAISAIDKFDAFILKATLAVSDKGLLPEGY